MFLQRKDTVANASSSRAKIKVRTHFACHQMKLLYNVITDKNWWAKSHLVCAAYHRDKYWKLQFPQFTSLTPFLKEIIPKTPPSPICMLLDREINPHFPRAPFVGLLRMLLQPPSNPLERSRAEEVMYNR